MKNSRIQSPDECPDPSLWEVGRNDRIDDANASIKTWELVGKTYTADWQASVIQHNVTTFNHGIYVNVKQLKRNIKR